ncbi:hypothetical protein BGZ83_001431 [Gryganskiella cystojenkinii]|nr:hypothetical protein BGZ83_001431 [Gryganskiella cystojenkinii]
MLSPLSPIPFTPPVSIVFWELSEIILASILAQKENQAKQSRSASISSASSSSSLTSSTASSPTSPSMQLPASKAIKIVDPNSRTPLFIPTTNKAPTSSTHGRHGGRYTNSVSSTPVPMTASSDSYFNLFSSASRQQQQQQQQQSQMFGGMYGSQVYQFTPQLQQQQQHQQQYHAYSMGMTSPTMDAYSPPRPVSRIPIVNPDNGSIVSAPATPSTVSSGAPWHHNHFVAVR